MSTVEPEKFKCFGKYLRVSFNYSELQIGDDCTAFEGVLKSVVSNARRILVDRIDSQVRFLTRLGDILIWSGIENGSFFDSVTGSTIKLAALGDEVELEMPSLLPYAAMMFERWSRNDQEVAVIGEDSDHEENFIVDGQRFCAAVALVEVAEALRHEHVDWWAVNGVYHAMRAAEAMACSRFVTLMRDNKGMSDIYDDATAKAVQEAKKLLAMKGADALHAENRAAKQEVLKAYRDGSYPSKNKAAEVLAKKFPYSVMTIRSWLKEA